MIKKLFIVFALFLTACVYRLDIHQGNALAQKDVDNLRSGLTKNQVVFILGTPVLSDNFADDNWVYLYTYKSSNKNIFTQRKLELAFDGDKLISASGDFKIPENLTIKK